MSKLISTPIVWNLSRMFCSEQQFTSNSVMTKKRQILQKSLVFLEDSLIVEFVLCVQAYIHSQGLESVRIFCEDRIQNNIFGTTNAYGPAKNTVLSCSWARPCELHVMSSYVLLSCCINCFVFGGIPVF